MNALTHTQLFQPLWSTVTHQRDLTGLVCRYHISVGFNNYHNCMNSGTTQLAKHMVCKLCSSSIYIAFYTLLLYHACIDAVYTSYVLSAIRYNMSPLLQTRQRTSPDIPLVPARSSHEYDDTINTTQVRLLTYCLKYMAPFVLSHCAMTNTRK